MSQQKALDANVTYTVHMIVLGLSFNPNYSYNQFMEMLALDDRLAILFLATFLLWLVILERP